MSRWSSRTARFGSAGSPGAGSPFFGNKLLVADRGNDRLLLLNDRNQIVWKYPSHGTTGAPRRLLLPRRRLLHPPRAGDHLQPGGQRHDRRDRLSVGAHHLPLRAPADSGIRPGLPEHAGRRLPARQRADDGRRPRELPCRHHQPAHEARRASDRNSRPLPARPAALRSARRTATRPSRTATS